MSSSDPEPDSSPTVETLVVPTLVTERLTIRALREDDLADVHQLMLDIGWADPDLSPVESRERRETWLRWTIDGNREFARLNQPPLGERAVISRDNGTFLGMVGLVPSFAPFGRLPSFGARADARRTLEMGLFWAFSPVAQGRGLATEAARALVDWAFAALVLEHLVATTEYENARSIGVMRRLGMSIERNPADTPDWFQIVGVLKAPAEAQP